MLEVIFEFVTVGNFVKISAIDVETGTEKPQSETVGRFSVSFRKTPCSHFSTAKRGI